MTITARGDRFASRLRIGDVVEVRSKDEILATLDGRAELEALPFMPEMLSFCGRRLTVAKLAIKLCDTKDSTGFHRLDGAVHLAGVRCDGSAHGDCQAGCLLYWKEAWLRRVDDENAAQSAAVGPGCTEAQLFDATRAPSAADPARSSHDPEVRYACQATELTRAAPKRIPWWNARQYVRDVRVGNARLLPMLRSVLIMLFNKVQGANRHLMPQRPLIRGARNYPFIEGRPKEQRALGQELGLQPGDWVRVRPRDEILATLDTNARHKGLMFDAEMLRYCGRLAQVRTRVDRIIEEKTGRMLRLRSDAVILDGVVCTGDYNLYCPRGIYPMWREAWLERAAGPARAAG